MSRKDTAPAENPQGARPETVEEYKSRIARAGGNKRTENLWRRQAAELGMTYEAYRDKREQAAKAKRMASEARQHEMALARAEAERLGVTVEWMRSKAYRELQRKQNRLR